MFASRVGTVLPTCLNRFFSGMFGGNANDPQWSSVCARAASSGESCLYSQPEPLRVLRVFSPLLGADVAPRMRWARDSSGGATAGAEGPAGLRRQAREEVRAALDALLRDGSLLCLIPVAAPPPLPGGAADPAYRARTFELQGPAGVAGLPQLVVPVGSHGGLPLAVSLIAARGHDRRLLALAARVGRSAAA